MQKILTRVLGVTLLLCVFCFAWPGTWATGSLAGKATEVRVESNQAIPNHSSPTTPLMMADKIKTCAAWLLTMAGVKPEVVDWPTQWIMGALALGIVLLIVLRLRVQKKVAQPKSRVSFSDAQSGSSSMQPLFKTGQSSAKVSDKDQILFFFLSLFKYQENFELDAPSEMVLMESRATCPNDTYEMRVLHKGEWVKRRMSIGLLGQGGGSRSKCYYVIYDSHLVIKMPAEPITDFSSYNRRVAAENDIVARLAPRSCIVPRVSVILKAIHVFPDGGTLSEDALEAKFIRLMETNPTYQEYLKIGGSFAFFMDLAKHFFLSTILEEIHGSHGRMVDEALGHPDLLWDHHAFVCRYGEHTGAVCYELQELYFQCEGQLRHLIDHAGIVDDVPDYILKQWFLSHLAGEKIDGLRLDLRSDIVQAANQILTQAIESYPRQVDEYRRELRTYIRETRFSQHLKQLESLAANTLELLSWVNEKGLALRDLKPENLFVAGHPDDYPIFMNDPEKFSIGLIDVETAVVIDGYKPDKIAQPQLAGTPLYATPAHLLFNKVLEQVYGDLRTTLHLQDWHASVAIMFKIVTGENLFSITAHAFPEIISQIKLLDLSRLDIDKDVAKINRIYWNSAVAEFREKMHRYQTNFSRVVVRVPRSLVPEIRGFVAKEIERMEATIGSIVAAQSFFSSEKKVSFLVDASTEKIAWMKNKLHQEGETSEPRMGERSQVLRFLERLEGIKKELQRSRSTFSFVDAPKATMPADQLLKAMFQRVFSHMYPARWPSLSPAKWSGSAQVSADFAAYQATL